MAKDGSKMHNLESIFQNFAGGMVPDPPNILTLPRFAHPHQKILATPLLSFHQVLLSFYATSIHKYVCVLCILNHVYFQYSTSLQIQADVLLVYNNKMLLKSTVYIILKITRRS